MTTQTQTDDRCTAPHADIYLAMIGDCVVGAGDTADEAIADARARDPHCEQAGSMSALLFPDWTEYEIGSILDWDQMHNC
jgi:hypothetical protein